MTEQEAISLAAEPNKIIDPLQANLVIGFLTGKINDLSFDEFEGEVACNNHLVNLLHTEGKTNKVAEAEFKTSEIYIKWRRIKLELQKLRSYRQVLRKKEETLMSTSKYIRERGNHFFSEGG